MEKVSTKQCKFNPGVDCSDAKCHRRCGWDPKEIIRRKKCIHAIGLVPCKNGLSRYMVAR